MLNPCKSSLATRLPSTCTRLGHTPTDSITRWSQVLHHWQARSSLLWDPLSVQPILPVPSGWLEEDRSRTFDMLTAFFGPGYRDWWLSYARDPSAYTCLYFNNHWLVRQFASVAFSRGVVKLNRRQPSMIEYQVRFDSIGPEQPLQLDGANPLLGDHSRTGIMTVDPRFLGTHARLCRSIQFVKLAKKFARDSASPSSHLSLGDPETEHRPQFGRIDFGSLSASILQSFCTCPTCCLAPCTGRSTLTGSSNAEKDRVAPLRA